ncbi:spore coat protein F-like protein YraD [Cohnella xylanilytica]|uniref:Spore coat protein n=1 Tax=Cohnella xylanilytica TaxID=557555 RepID=A0A841TYX9_9BACL|nr:spore coat protein [Cohnella xylanilytica]MBB6692749.1 spore coat protein [Cohnella xylanilytica]GIO12704.1 spore coat protein F-like protein YraD [Cohnella xylanilytica]
MNSLIERLTGMHTLTDQVVATDLLIAAKSGVRNYAMAATEVATPEIKAILAKQLDEAIDLHERIADYMIQKGWYHPWDVKEQLRLDLQNARTALNAPTL